MIHNLLETSSRPGDDHFQFDLVDLLVLLNLVEDLLIEGFPIGYIFAPSFSRSRVETTVLHTMRMAAW